MSVSQILVKIISEAVFVAEMQRHRDHTYLNELQVRLVPFWTADDAHEIQLASYRNLLAYTFDTNEVHAILSDLEVAY